MVSCILLSAGLSERFGSPKALAIYERNTTLIKRQQIMLVDSQVDEMIIVLGAYAAKIRPQLLKHKKIKVVYNKDYNLGQTSSFKVGLQVLKKAVRGVMLLPVDFPCIKTKTINLLINYFIEKSPLILIPTFKGTKGHPPIFGAKLKDDFLKLPLSSGLNTIAHQYVEAVNYLPVEDQGILKSFNTQEEYAQLIKEMSKK